MIFVKALENLFVKSREKYFEIIPAAQEYLENPPALKKFLEVLEKCIGKNPRGRGKIF